MAALVCVTKKGHTGAQNLLLLFFKLTVEIKWKFPITLELNRKSDSNARKSFVLDDTYNIEQKRFRADLESVDFAFMSSC